MHRRSMHLSVLFVVPMTLSVACATAPTPVHMDPPGPQIAQTGVVKPGSAFAAIQPDRPDVTNGTYIVEEGLLQAEVGVQRVRMGTQRNVGTPLTLRIGLFEWLEGRISTDGFLHQTDLGSSVSGSGNMQVGAKVRLFAEPGGIPVLSMLPTITLPAASASKGLGSGQPDVTLVVLTGTDLGQTSHIDFNYGIGAIGAGQGRAHFAQHLVSVSFSHSLTEQLSPYLEGFWFSRQDPHGSHVFSLDAGAIQAFTARLAVDGGVALGLTRAAPDVSVFAGVSIIVGDVLGDHGVIARQRKAARLQGRTQH
jgi:hypothetical protein